MQARLYLREAAEAIQMGRRRSISVRVTGKP